MRRLQLVLICLTFSLQTGQARSADLTFNGAQLLSACTKADREWIGFSRPTDFASDSCSLAPRSASI
jgi:hypothetical protein